MTVIVLVLGFALVVFAACCAVVALLIGGGMYVEHVHEVAIQDALLSCPPVKRPAGATDAEIIAAAKVNIALRGATRPEMQKRLSEWGVESPLFMTPKPERSNERPWLAWWLQLTGRSRTK
jgi:hypothetical protein